MAPLDVGSRITRPNSGQGAMVEVLILITPVVANGPSETC
jgi:hypothetical protein